MCVSTLAQGKVQTLFYKEGGEIVMHYEEVTLRTKKIPPPSFRDGGLAPSVSIKSILKKQVERNQKECANSNSSTGLGSSRSKKKHVRFASDAAHVTRMASASADAAGDAPQALGREGACHTSITTTAATADDDFVLVSHRDAAGEAESESESRGHDPPTSSLASPALAAARSSSSSSSDLNEVCCLLTPSSEMSPLVKAQVWWQARDYEVFKGTARLISAEIRRRSAEGSRTRSGRVVADGSESYDAVLTRTLDLCGSLPAPAPPPPFACGGGGACQNDGNIDENDEDDASFHPLPRRLFAYLTHWVRVGYSRRGLERWTVASHAEVRHTAREDALRAVLREQKRLRDMGMGASGRNGEDAIAERLRRLCKRKTRSARLFALAIGHADAAAVGSSVTDPTNTHRKKSASSTPPTTSNFDAAAVDASPRSVAIHTEKPKLVL